ncbi:hypothetical protein J1N35_014048 [Gossypium stocksii]|uniref:CCHC-type domain-containing protein n=1 Tax=Gossypium stocksii TaxID=47602 RepID=A0A9D3VTK0_9ROSI|nr:hypothetical protein J1N35_014048 [Gossypium stocksii]
MEEELASLSLLDDEEEAFQEEIAVVEPSYQFCLVGRCITDSVVHFPSLRNTMADFWHPIGGVCITDLGDKRYLFQFFHDVDVQRVLSGTPWFFNNHLFILKKIQNDENPLMVDLNSTEFWVQVHELPLGLMFEAMAKQFGAFLGKFLEYDASIPTLGVKKYMRIRVCLDVSAPLRRKKKILIENTVTIYALFKYEKLSLFCFICGKMGHGESYCPFRLRIEPSKIVFGWDLSLRATPKRRNLVTSRWLCETDGARCSDEKMERLNHGSMSVGEKDTRRDFRGDSRNQISNPNLIPLGPTQNQQYFSNGQSNWCNWNNGDSGSDGLVNGPMDLVIEEENDPIANLDGKKRQRVVEGPQAMLGSKAEVGTLAEVAHALAVEGWRRQVFGDWADGVSESVQALATKKILRWNQDC